MARRFPRVALAVGLLAALWYVYLTAGLSIFFGAIGGLARHDGAPSPGHLIFSPSSCLFSRPAERGTFDGTRGGLWLCSQLWTRRRLRSGGTCGDDLGETPGDQGWG